MYLQKCASGWNHGEVSQLDKQRGVTISNNLVADVVRVADSCVALRLGLMILYRTRQNHANLGKQKAKGYNRK